MTLDSTKDLLFLVLAIASAWVAVFICWVLYEIGRMLRQANQVVSEAREKVRRIEQSIGRIREKIESASYLGAAAELGKAAFSFIKSRQEKKTDSKKKGKRKVEEE